jgi:mono/diheme cytochrome c family protein
MSRQVKISLVLLLIVLGCVPRNKVRYQFPETMSEDVKAGYLAQFNKGKVLYEINCAKCHNVTVRGKEYVPDFTPGQLAGYEMRIGNPQHIENLPETKVSEDEIVLILTFLRYKKPNGVTESLDTSRHAQ